MQKINPYLWFNNEAEEAAKLYTSVFKNAEITGVHRAGEAVMMATFTLAGLPFMALNGGPEFRPNSSISFFVNCETEEEVDKIWNKLIEGGKAMMPLDKYPFSEKYGWLEDRYGVSWQIMLSRQPQSISPALLFAGANQGRAEEAINFYTSQFPNSKIDRLARYEVGEQGPEGKLKYASFTLNGQPFVAMDSGVPMEMPFTPGVSLFINCENQAEVDKFWENLSEGGRQDRCGWLQDKFGVSWQVVPTALGRLMGDKDPAKSGRVMQAMLKMTKMDIAKLEDAAEGVAA